MASLKQLRLQQTWEPRTCEVPTPSLMAIGVLAWKLKAPTANDLAAARESMENRTKREVLLNALERSEKSAAIAAVREALGLTDDVRPDIARRIELIVRCTIEPETDEEDAVWLADNHPVLFFDLTNKCLDLANQGSSVKKTPMPSTEIPESETPSPSAE